MKHSRHEKGNQDGSPLWTKGTQTTHSQKNKEIQVVNGHCIFNKSLPWVSHYANMGNRDAVQSIYEQAATYGKYIQCSDTLYDMIVAVTESIKIYTHTDGCIDLLHIYTTHNLFHLLSM